MKVMFAAMALALTLDLAGPLAAHGSDKMSGMAMSGHAAKTGHAIGVVKAIDKEAGTVTIKHGAIPSVGWPAMTMTFKAKPATLLSGLTVGQTIAFDMKTRGSDAEITRVRPAS